jgi:hypothetical protein
MELIRFTNVIHDKSQQTDRQTQLYLLTYTRVLLFVYATYQGVINYLQFINSVAISLLSQ